MNYAIVIPCFNAHEFLEETIQSALSQTLPAHEVIVVDDGSTDPTTARELERLEAAYPVKVVRKANGGLSSARNAGIGASTSDVILPLDADDLIHPRYAEWASPQLAGGAAAVVYGGAVLFGTTNERWNLPPFSADRLLFENHIYASAFFRKDSWEAAGGYDEQLKHGREDHDFWIRVVLGLGTPVHRLDQVVFYYRQHGQSMNRDLGADRQRYVDTYARIFSKNAEIYAAHAEAVVQGHLKLVDRNNEWRHRYGKLERLITGEGPVRRGYDLARRLRRRLS